MGEFTSDCFTCPSWTGTGCSLTACMKLKTTIYIDGELIELGWHD